MKTAISIPDGVFREVNRAAKRLGVSRSALFARAVSQLLASMRDEEIQASYNAAFGDAKDDADARFLRSAARKTLRTVEWEDA